MAATPLIALPPELRTFGEFLSTDDRPTAILNSHGAPQAEIIYENASFKLRNLKEDVEGVLRDRHGRDRSALCSAEIEDRRWRVRQLLGKWTVVYLVSEGQLQEKEERRTSFDDRPSTQGDSISQSQDWTRFMVPELSPWVEHVRSFDWGTTALGPMSRWSSNLRGYVLHIMHNPNPRLIIWGESKTFIYNEACIPHFGDKHPHGLGRPASEVWSEVWHKIGPLVASAFQGKTSKAERVSLAMNRKNFNEETYWDFTMLPITGSDGHVVGMLEELTETTKLVLGERRRASVMSLSKKVASASSLQDLWSSYLEGLETATEDVPFALLYTVVDDFPEGDTHGRNLGPYSGAKKCVLAGTVGVPSHHPDIHQTFGLLEHIETGPGLIKPCLQVWKSRQGALLKSEDGSLPPFLAEPIAGRAFGERIKNAMISPLSSVVSEEILGILITGLNPRSSFDDEYSLYTHFISDGLVKAAALLSLPMEQRRAQKIADEMNMALAAQLKLITVQAERKEARYLRMGAEAPTGMFVTEPNGRSIYVNDAYLNMIGETRIEHETRSISAMAWKELIHPDHIPKFKEAWHRMLEQKVPLSIEHRLKTPWTSIDKASGQEISGERWLLANAFPDVEPDGRVSSVQGWLTDISHRKFTESLLSRKLDDALENKRQTENFIDMTSHEMRNPLSAILQSADSIVSTVRSAGTEMMEEPIPLSHVTADEIVDAAHTIILCAQHQKRIVDDILTLSKLDASLLVISPDKVQPPMLVKKALKMFEAEIVRGGITATVEIESSYRDLDLEWVVLDPSRLLQVIINLLTNAVKFTQYSQERAITICLGASYERPTGRHHGVDFIPPRHAEPAHSPLDEWGSSKDIYLQIAVTDTGRGLSEDEISMLFQRFSQASPRTYKQYGGSGLGLFISRELCELQGGQIGVASGNGKTTFTFFVRAKRAPTDKSARPPFTRFTSASASPMAFTRRGSVVIKDSGNDIREKPARLGALSENEPSKNGVTNGAHPTMQLNAPQDKKQLHVLVVEDNMINQKIMGQQLRKAGCVVHVANHGLECLDFLEKTEFCSADIPLSVILLDLEMPTMDGLTCIRHIRERQLGGKIISHVPVIAVTANARSEQIHVAIEAGMDSVVTKPFRIPELIPQMEALIAEVALRDTNG